MGTKTLDIKNFQPYSSAEDNDSVLMAKMNGTDGRISVALLRSQLGSEVKPSIVDGMWYIGKVNTNITAEGKTPIFRTSALGVEYKYEREAGDAWRLLIGYDALKLKFSDLTPAQKQELKMRLSDLTASEIAELQRPASDTIAAVQKTDREAQAAEVLRVSAENSRVTAEGKRSTEEGKRDAAEKLRAQKEVSREQKEEIRVTDESNRRIKESERIKEETARNQKETARQSAEEARATKEANRVSAESARVVAGNNSKEAEANRVAAENTRIAAEESRVEEYADVILQTNEAKNQSIEATKNVNEAIQKAVAAAGGADDARDAANAATAEALSAAGDVEEAKALSVQAAAAAIAAAKNADAAGGHANEQAEAARMAADRSNVLSDNPAKIIDDEWHKYNEETGAYVAIGVQAKGDVGSSFRVVGNYNTYDLLLAAVPDGTGVDGVYGIGEAPPYTYYAWTLKDTVWGWNVQGKLQGQRGESAFEGAVRMQGYEGTEQEYAVSPILNAKLALDAAKKAGDDTADFLKASAKSVSETIVRMTELSDNPMKIVEGVWYKYDEEAGEYVSTGVRAIPIDWRVRDLDHEPTAADVTYHDEDTGLNIAYPVGAEVRVRDGDEYLFYKLYDLLDGVASWDESGGGGALPTDVILCSPMRLNENENIYLNNGILAK